MEFFEDGTHVRLRSRGDGTYLHADEDGWGVSMSPHRASLNTAWAVHLLPRMDGDPELLLHSAANGGYLGVMFDYDDEEEPQPQPQPQSQQGQPIAANRVVQCTFNTPLQPDIMWEAEPEDGGVSLRPRVHGAIAFHITVEVIPRRRAAPPLPDQIPNGIVGAPVLPSRMIRYMRADDSGIFILAKQGTIQFQGRSLRYLISDLANRLGEDDNPNNITLCVRPGFLGRLTPLVMDLPISEEMMDIVVLTTGSAAARELRHPNVDAA